MHYIIPSTLPYYVRSGYINLVNARFRNAGLNGYDWSGFARTWVGTHIIFCFIRLTFSRVKVIFAIMLSPVGILGL